MSIPPEIVEQVRQSVDIVDIIDSYVPLKRSGANFKALSPFNKEKTPSFFVNPQRQIFKCFSSGHGGDVFKFLMLYEHLDFPAAVRRLAEKAGIPIPEQGRPVDDAYRQERDRLLTLHSEIAVRWRDLLLHDPSAEKGRQYMHSREIPLNWATEYGLGFAPEKWDDTLEWAKKKGYTPELLLKSGLVVRNEQGRVYDRFRGRLIFPIHNDAGQVIGFSARLLDPDAKAAKYVNSPETSLFVKSRVLFGFDRAKRAIADADRVVVCEGQIDVLRCHASGIANAVAPLGTAFTEEHAKLIRRFTRNIVLCLDADAAGQRAAERVADVIMQKVGGVEMLMEADLGISVVRLPEGHDPDSLLRQKGVEAFRDLLSGAVDYIDFLLGQLTQRHGMDTMSGRRRVIEEAAAFLVKIPGTTYREQLFQACCTRLEISSGALEEEMRKQRPRQTRREGGEVGTSEAPPKERVPFSCEPQLQELILLAASHPGVIPELQRQIAPEWYRDRKGAELFERMVELYTHEEAFDLAGMLSFVGEEEQNFLAGLDLDLLKDLPESGWAALVGRLARKLQVAWLMEQAQIVGRKLRDPKLDPAERQALLSRQGEILKSKNSLTSGS